MGDVSDWKDGVVAIIGRRPDQEATGPIGVGFIVSPEGLIATCAHVVDDSPWKRDWDSPLQIRFQANRHYAGALVLEEYYKKDGLDLAILRLQADLPEGVIPLPLCSSAGAKDHTTTMWGFPNLHPKGIYGRGQVHGIEGRERLQLSSTQASKGFSGGPVWDDQWQRVIGMILSGSIPDTLGRLQFETFALPAERLVEACPGLALTPPRMRPSRGKPLQRPPRAEHFTGREDDLAWLLDALQPGRCVTVWASGGMGKTALAAEALWHLAPGDDPPERFRDGIIFHAFYGRPDTALALEHIVKSFDETALDISEDAARRTLAGKRTLLVLDGAEEAADLAAVLRLRDSNRPYRGYRAIYGENDILTSDVRFENLEQLAARTQSRRKDDKVGEKPTFPGGLLK